MYNYELVKPEETPFNFKTRYMEFYKIKNEENILETVEDFTKDDDSLIWRHLKNLADEYENDDEEDKNWQDVNYTFDYESYSNIKKTLKTNNIKVRINESSQQIIIVSTPIYKKSHINVNKRVLVNKDKTIVNLSKDINDALKHIELIITSKYFCVA